MSALSVALLAGILVFVAIYLSFDELAARIGSRLLKVRDDTLRIYNDMFVQKTPEQVLRQQAMMGGGLAAFFLLLSWPHVASGFVFALGAFCLGWWLPYLYLNLWVRPRRVGQFSIQMVDALTLMSNGLRSGLNIPQTLQIVVDEMPNPIKQEFGFVLSENRLGMPLEEAFENLGRRIPSEDVKMFVTSVNILSETGGNIAETFQNITKTIRERLKLQSKISAMTAQGMTSAVIVGALPPVLAVMLYAADPQQMGPLFFTVPGWVILLMMFGLEAVGFWVILKIVRIKV